MMIYRTLIYFLSLNFLACSSHNCFSNNTVCEKPVEYYNEPAINLFIKKDDEYRLINPPKDKIGFYISSKEFNNNSYIAFQIYKNDFKCEDKPYIYGANVNYNIELYVFDNTNGQVSNIKIIQESLPKEIDLWKKSLKINTKIPLACENGKINYGPWNRKF